MKYGFFFFISVLAFVACQENEISTFDNESSLFFFRDIYNNNSKGTPQLDSTPLFFWLGIYSNRYGLVGRVAYGVAFRSGSPVSYRAVQCRGTRSRCCRNSLCCIR